MINIENAFNSYSMTEEDEVESKKLTNLQLKRLQNLRAEVANDRLALEVDTNNIQKFIQSEAYYKGKLDLLLQLMLDSQER